MRRWQIRFRLAERKRRSRQLLRCKARIAKHYCAGRPTAQLHELLQTGAQCNVRVFRSQNRGWRSLQGVRQYRGGLPSVYYSPVNRVPANDGQLAASQTPAELKISATP